LSDEIDPSGHSGEKERGAFCSDRSRFEKECTHWLPWMKLQLRSMMYMYSATRILYFLWINHICIHNS